jgi:cell division septal protein FtsQ
MKRILHVIVGVGLFGAFTFLVLPRYGRWLKEGDCFRIRKIEVDGNDLVSQKDILRLARIRKNDNIWGVDVKAAEARISANPFIGRVSVFRRHPDGIQILIDEKKPVALWKTQGHLYALDRDLTLLPANPGKCYSLPILSCSAGERPAFGKTVTEKTVQEGMAFLLFMLKDRPDLYPQISEISPQDEGLILYTARGGIPVKIGRGGYDWKIRYLEAILAEMESNPSLTNAEYIDLRYEGQVFVGFGV